MPSGSKRRKAAKKKKEKEAPISDSSTLTNDSNDGHENDEVRGHDEKDSDGGEPNSPAFHDQHGPFNAGTQSKPVDIPVDSAASRKIEEENNGGAKTAKEMKFEDDSPIPIQHGPFNGGTESKPADIPVDSAASRKIKEENNGGAKTAKEMKFEDDSPIPIQHGPFNGGTESKPADIQVDSDASQKIEEENNGGAKTAKEVKFEDDSPIPIKHVEPMKEQHDEDNEKSSIFRSDGESLVTEEEKCGDEEGSKDLETAEFEDLEMPGASLPKELTKVLDGGLGEDVNVAELVVSLSEKVIDSTEAAPSENKADFGLNSRGKEDLLTSIDEVQQVASNGLESASNNVGAKAIPTSVENSGVEYGAKTSVSKEMQGEFFPCLGVSVTQTHNAREKAKDFQVCKSNDGLESASNDAGAKSFPMLVENSGVESGAVTSILKEKDGELLPTPGFSVVHSHHGTEKAEDFKVCEPNNGLESASNNVEAKVFPVLVENSVIESRAVTSVSKGKEGEFLPSPGVLVAQTHNGTEKAKDFAVCEPNNGLDSASNKAGAKVFPLSVENSVTESGAATSILKEKEGELLPSLGVSVVQTHNGTERTKDFAVREPNNGLESVSNNFGPKVSPVSVENSDVESGAVTSVSSEKEGELLPSPGVSVAQTCDGTEKAKDVEVCESSEDQPLVGPASRTVEKTSWMSCCGLLDIFMGSSR